MQAGELLSLIKNPASLQPEDVSRLERLTGDFPYFQPARMLLCLAARKWDAGVYQQQLKRTAIAASNRGHLYDLIKGLEKQMQLATTETVETNAIAEVKSQAKDYSTEEELRIVNANADIRETKTIKTEKGLPSSLEEKLPEDFLEKEIQKQVTVAVVDKEIISAEDHKDSEPAPESEKIIQPSEPGSFSDWLEQLKKPLETAKPSFKKKKDSQELTEPLPKAFGTQTEPQAQPQAPSEEVLKAKRLKQKALIDKIIESSPGVIRPKEDQKFFTPERKAKESLLENEHLVTETLAKIYAMQGNISKAIRSYEILSLKYPQKSAYFASLIQKLKQNQ
ncbi:MAG: hypothetical protein JNK73_13655 [Bacteroidia bacterium]|nr:hypothetical protein [Bacteroidia bacterium]